MEVYDIMKQINDKIKEVANEFVGEPNDKVTNEAIRQRIANIAMGEYAKGNIVSISDRIIRISDMAHMMWVPYVLNIERGKEYSLYLEKECVGKIRYYKKGSLWDRAEFLPNQPVEYIQMNFTIE